MRLDALQASFAVCKLKVLSELIDARRKNEFLYIELLSDEKNVRVPRPDVANSVSSFHTFVVKAFRRNDLVRWLSSFGIETKVHYPVPISKLESAPSLDIDHSLLSNTYSAADQILSLPIHQHLTNDQVVYVVDKIKEFYGRPIMYN